MNINSLLSLPAAASAVPSSVAAVNPKFRETLEKITSITKGKSAARKQAEEAAAGLVSNALILPILKQLRRSTFNTEGPFSPGNGEKAFGPQFDMQLADSIAHSPRLGVKNALADRLMKRNAAAKPATAAHKGLDVHG